MAGELPMFYDQDSFDM